MPTTTYTPLANITLGSTAASVNFSSISGSYRDLVLVVSATHTSNKSLSFQVNGDTASNYSLVTAFGNGSTAGSNSTSSTGELSTNYGTGGDTSSTGILNVMDYSATDKHKTLMWRTNMPNTATVMGIGRWANTAAITSLQVFINSGSFSAGSTFALYGIAS